MPAREVPLTLLDPEGGWLNAPVHVHELRGRPTLLHFESTRSETCLEQLDEVRGWLRDYVPRGLRVVGVHVPLRGEDFERAMDTNVLESLLVKELGFHHPIAVDDGSMARGYGVEVVPTYLVFDAEGWLRHRASGPKAVRHMRRVLELMTGPVEAAPSPAAS